MPLEAELEKRRQNRLAVQAKRDLDKVRKKCETLTGFIREAWPVLEPSAPYVYCWHHDAIAEHLEAITAKQITRLQINQPPGSMKSMIASVMWEAWEWGPAKRTGLRYFTTSYREDYARRDSRKHRDLVQSEWYQALWPEVQLTRDNETDFENTMRGGRKAVPYKSLTAGRGNRLILDDPHSVSDVESDAVREEAVRLFRESGTSRLNDPVTDAILVIMHRLHTRDICGEIEKLGLDYVKLVLPMEYDPKTTVVTKWFTDPREKEGELLCPQRLPRDVVDKNKKELGSHAYNTQYQQKASAREGGMFKRHWFNRVTAIPAEPMRWVRRYDLGGTEATQGADPDWTAGVKMGITTDGRIYIAHVDRFREKGAVVRKAIKNNGVADGKHVHIVVPQDPGQAGKSQVTDIIKENQGYRIYAFPETGAKDVRAEPLAAQAEAGNVYVLEAEWTEAFIDELCSFPQGHDDQFDAASGAYNYLTGKPRGPRVSQEALDRIKGKPVTAPNGHANGQANGESRISPRVFSGYVRPTLISGRTILGRMR